MAAGEPESLRIVLTKSEDWKLWLPQVQAKAVNYTDVWDYIDPDREGTAITPPPKPAKVNIQRYITIPDGVDQENIMELIERASMTPEKQVMYQMAQKFYKDALADHESFIKGISEVTNLIISTTGTAAKPFLEEIGETEKLPKIMKDLKNRFALTKNELTRLIQRKYVDLCKSPKESKIDKWLTNWEKNHAECTYYKMKESNEEQSIRDFITAVQPLSEVFYNQWSFTIRSESIEDKGITLQAVLKDFRRYQLEEYLREGKKSTDLSFATYQGEKAPTTSNGNSSTEKKDSRSSKKKCPCRCYRSWERCYYMNPSIQPANWVPIKEKKEKVNKALKNEDFKKKVQQVIKEFKKKSTGEAKESSTNSSNAVTNTTNEKKVGFM